MKHPNQMKVQPQFSEVYVWLKKHKTIINDSACLCLPCVKQIQRNHSKEFTPRWLPKPPVPPKLCNIEHCMHTVYAQTTLINTDELESCLKAKVNAYTVTSGQSTSIRLCREHYVLIFAQMQMRLIFVFGYIVKSLVVSISYYIHQTQMCTTLASL